VITPLGGNRPDVDEQVALPGDPGGEPPGTVTAGWTGLIGGGEAEPCSAGRVRIAGRAGFVPFSTVPLVAGGCGPSAAVPDGVPLAVGDRHAPGRPRVAGGGRGQIAGQVGVDRPNPSNFAGLATSVNK
jgi:hypothetical protein